MVTLKNEFWFEVVLHVVFIFKFQFFDNFEGSLRNGAWYSEVFADIRKNHSDYKIVLMAVEAPGLNIQNQVWSRAHKEKRVVDQETLVGTYNLIPDSIGMLESKADLVFVMANIQGIRPQKDAINLKHKKVN